MWFDFYVSIYIFLVAKYGMLSYLPFGFIAERSYVQRKAHIISFFLIYLFMKVYFIKLRKNTSSTNKLITTNQGCSESGAMDAKRSLLNML